MTYHTCRLCDDNDPHRPLFRFGIRHYAHAECGLEKWGSEFVRMIPRYEIGALPYCALMPYPEARQLAVELYEKGGAQ